MSLVVDEPILNNPFEELREYRLYVQGHKRNLKYFVKGFFN
jgi:hypothetical protein